MVQNYNFVLQLTGALVEVELSDLGLSPYSSYSIKGRDCGSFSDKYVQFNYTLLEQMEM